ncbi:hypothetical protein SASPL_155925 [Salvia splendens]|uniref:Uncharacterized protein n=1 Tax=Salvia splendens TaxID=180675 RepID=A0A8X8YXV2_SALSN|nr:hypothetical protein SASPL_155925 [Salvia splendens]
MGGGDQGAQQALQNLAGLLLLPRRHRPRIRHRHLLLRGPTARLNVPDCVPSTATRTSPPPPSGRRPPRMLYCTVNASERRCLYCLYNVLRLKSLVAPPLCKKQVICRMNKEGYLWM